MLFASFYPKSECSSFVFAVSMLFSSSTVAFAALHLVNRLQRKWSRVGDDNSYKNAVPFVIVLVAEKTNKAASKPIADPSSTPSATFSISFMRFFSRRRFKCATIVSFLSSATWFEMLIVRLCVDMSKNK